jgi:hypothetical protein
MFDLRIPIKSAKHKNRKDKNKLTSALELTQVIVSGVLVQTLRGSQSVSSVDSSQSFGLDNGRGIPSFDFVPSLPVLFGIWQSGAP